MTTDDLEPLMRAAYQRGYQHGVADQRPAIDAWRRQALSETGCGVASPHFVQTEVSIGWATSYEVPADGVTDAAGIALASAKRTHQRRDRSTVHNVVHSVWYHPDPPVACAQLDVGIPAQVRRTLDRPTVRSGGRA